MKTFIILALIAGLLIGKANACDIEGYDIYDFGSSIEMITNNLDDYIYHKCENDIWSTYTKKDPEIIVKDGVEHKFKLIIFTLESDNNRIGQIRLEREFNMGKAKWDLSFSKGEFMSMELMLENIYCDSTQISKTMGNTQWRDSDSDKLTLWIFGSTVNLDYISHEQTFKSDELRKKEEPNDNFKSKM